MNPQIKDNPKWKPYLRAIRNASGAGGFVLDDFLDTFPSRCRVAVALALSVAKWFLICQHECIESFTGTNCGCCRVFGGGECSACPLDRPSEEWAKGCVVGTNEEVYSRILAIYVEHFNALPERDKQRLAA